MHSKKVGARWLYAFCLLSLQTILNERTPFVWKSNQTNLWNFQNDINSSIKIYRPNIVPYTHCIGHSLRVYALRCGHMVNIYFWFLFFTHCFCVLDRWAHRTVAEEIGSPVVLGVLSISSLKVVVVEMPGKLLPLKIERPFLIIQELIFWRI